MPNERPRLIFLSGDEEKAFSILKEWKQAWYPSGALSCEWEESSQTTKGKTTNFDSILDSLSFPPFNECHRTFVIKNPNDHARARKALIGITKNLVENTTVIVWDTKGFSDDKKTESPTWKDVREAFKANGKLIDAGKSLGDISEVSQVSWVVSVGEANGLTIPKEAAGLLLELFDRNRMMIESEIQNLAFMSDGVLDKGTVMENAMPVQQKYPIYKFYSAFNSGYYRDCMVAANELLDRGLTVDVLLGFAIKQARWQVAVAEALRAGKDPKSFTEKLASTNHSKIRKKLEADKSISRRTFLKSPSEMDDDELPKKENPPSAYSIREMTAFIAGIGPKLIHPDRKDKKKAICEELMKRYVALVDGMAELRKSKSDEKEACFVRVIKRITL